MKLDKAQVRRIRKEIRILPILDTEPTYYRLEGRFGEHTFYVDPFGLYVWEACEDADEGPTQVVALQIASWTDDNMTTLKAHPPTATGTVIVLDSVH